MRASILHFRAVNDGVDTSRCALDLDASSFALLSFPLLIQLVPTQTRRARLPVCARNPAGGQVLLIARTLSVPSSSSSSRPTRAVVFAVQRVDVGHRERRRRTTRWNERTNERTNDGARTSRPKTGPRAVDRARRTTRARRTRLETSRRSPTNVPRGTLHVTRVITRGCLRTGTFASHDS